jgi:hypothetical protein
MDFEFKTKYGCEGFEERNKFLHWNFFIFEIDFELKTKYGCEGLEERNKFLHRNFFIFEMNFELKNWKDKLCF